MIARARRSGNARQISCFNGCSRLELEQINDRINLDRRARLEAGVQHALRQWILDQILDDAPQRSRSVGVVVAAFAFAWWTRYSAADVAPSTTVFGIEAGALVLGAVAGWLGGELVDRLGVGVSTGANLNAPSSLSNRPATAVR